MTDDVKTTGGVLVALSIKPQRKISISLRCKVHWGHDGKTASQERLEYGRALSEIAFGSVGGLKPLYGRFPVMNSKQISSARWKGEQLVRSDWLRKQDT